MGSEPRKVLTTMRAEMHRMLSWAPGREALRCSCGETFGGPTEEMLDIGDMQEEHTNHIIFALRSANVEAVEREQAARMVIALAGYYEPIDIKEMSPERFAHLWNDMGTASQDAWAGEISEMLITVALNARLALAGKRDWLTTEAPRSDITPDGKRLIDDLVRAVNNAVWGVDNASASLAALQAYIAKLEATAAIYPCMHCDTMRTKSQGGTCFSVCEGCWNKPR